MNQQSLTFVPSTVQWECNDDFNLVIGLIKTGLKLKTIQLSIEIEL